MNTLKSIGLFILLFLVLGIVELLTQGIVLAIVFQFKGTTIWGAISNFNVFDYLINIGLLSIVGIPISLLSIKMTTWKVKNKGNSVQVLKYAVVGYIIIGVISRFIQISSSEDIEISSYIVSLIYFLIISIFAFEKEQR